MDVWVSTCHDSIKHNFILAVISDDTSSFHNSTDPCLLKWAEHTKALFHQAAHSFMASTVIEDTVNPWIIETYQAHKALAEKDSAKLLTNLLRDLCASAEQHANDNADTFYNATLATLKAKAFKCTKHNIAEYKSNLKVAADK